MSYKILMSFKMPCKYMFLLILFFTLKNVHAAGVFWPNNSNINLPATIEISKATSVGQVLWTSNRVTTTLRDGVTSKSRFSTSISGANLSTYGNNVYDSGVKGIGFRIVGVFKTPSETLNMYFGNESKLYSWPGDMNVYVTQEAYLELVLTSDSIDSGTVDLTGINAKLAFNLQDVSDVNQRWVITINGTTVIKKICYLNDLAISVPLGDIRKTSFNGPGTWPGDNNTRNFNVSLNCDAGARVDLKIDGNAYNAEKGIINISKINSSASGIGVQILYNNTPINLSMPIGLKEVVVDGIYNFTFQARYYQIENTIRPGIANAIATFTLTYH